LGAIGDELRAATVPVVRDLENVAFTPDLIHGHHHVETLIAALHFPGVPIVHFCHGWLPWEEEPLRHPSIVRYVAVDETCVDRLTAEGGIPRERVDLLHNFVDLERFAPRAPLPEKPRRALVLSNGADANGYAAMVKEACVEREIELEVAGLRSGRPLERPEEWLQTFDLVFAKGRTALEALAVGCSVILADVVGAGPLVTEPEFDRMRACNFGVRLLRNTHAVEWYRTQIAAYDAREAGRVSARVRDSADLEQAVDRLLTIYTAALSEHRDRPASSGNRYADCGVDEQRAASRHLCSVARRLKLVEAGVQRLSEELSVANRSRDDLVHDRDTHAHLVRRLTAELTAQRGLTQALIEERDHLTRRVAEYSALPSLRLRDKLVRVPLLGTTAQRAARWLTRSTP
jgi:glycosyltransferase involved in cell wall biosynthesis